MAQLYLEWYEYSCELHCNDFEGQCATGAAECLGCKKFLRSVFNSCVFCRGDRVTKMIIADSFTSREIKDPYNPHLNNMRVDVNGKVYHCVRVTVDGECIYGG